MALLETILPIFVVIGIGLLAGQRGYLPAGFLGSANRLVYHLAIPAMIFRAIAGGSLRHQFHLPVLAVALGAVAAGFAVASAVAGRVAPAPAARASFRQCAFHGNLGYIGLAVVYFYLGDEGLGRASILAGFIMILQNLLAVVALSAGRRDGLAHRWRQVLGNPVIVASMLGIACSALGLRLPTIADRSLEIVARMALPLALLVIGATLSPAQIRAALVPALVASVIKLGVMPALALGVCVLAAMPAAGYLPALILLASPTATVAYVMGSEMGGDPDLAAAAISLSTLLSGLTFIGWLALSPPVAGG
jgi:predicted permease